MGMFDEIICRFPLPSGYEHLQGRKFQTKSLACETCDTYTITDDGELYLTAHCGTKLDKAELVDFHGDIRFYDFENPNDRDLIAFNARFVEGQLSRIWVLADKNDGERRAASRQSVFRISSIVAGQITPDKLRAIQAQASANDVPLLVAEIERLHSTIDRLMDDMQRIAEGADEANELRARNAELLAACRPLVDFMCSEDAYPEDVFLALDAAKAAIENHGKANNHE